ncbi:hypothetical protein KP509_03G024900 [Ceratopteris richardii]|nr:hypothetical protein KP509_03G024900 [Ceratopteris richardii]
MEVAPADKLFYRGQLLPLESDPRLELVHALSNRKGQAYSEDYSDSKPDKQENALVQLISEEGLSFAIQDNEDDFPLHPGFKERIPVQCQGEALAYEHRETWKYRSQRSDGVFDTLRNDSCSSSFRSCQSSYWGSGEKDSRNSSSSSRCSNESSQDGVYNDEGRKAQDHKNAMSSSADNNNVDDHAVQKRAHHPHEGNPSPHSHIKGRKWSWKALLAGVRKASKLLLDEKEEKSTECVQRKDATLQRKSVFGFPTRGKEIGAWERQRSGSRSNYVVSAKVRKTRNLQSTNNRRNTGEDHRYGAFTRNKNSIGSVDYGIYKYYEGGYGRKPDKNRQRFGIIAWNARESWEKWIKRPLSGKLSHAQKGSALAVEAMRHSPRLKAKSVSSTPLAKSPARMVGIDMKAADIHDRSAKYASLGFAASCPASMRSSPHHSGVLVGVDQPPPVASLDDLHSAIQGAIAHCKLSHNASFS